MLRFGKATCFLLLFKFVLSERLSNNLWRPDILLFSELINIVPILYYKVIEFIIFLYSFLVILFAWYKENIMWRISFKMLLYLLPDFTCVTVILFLSICLCPNILIPSAGFVLYLASEAILKKSPNNSTTISCSSWIVSIFVICDGSFFLFWFRSSSFYIV